MFFCFILFIIISITLFCFNHCPRYKLDQEYIRRIKEYGLMHFTIKENVSSILQQGLKPNKKKALCYLERNMVWMYIAEPGCYEEKLREIHSKGKRSSYNAVIFIHNISDEDINRMRCRKKPEAIIHIGTLKTNCMEAKDA